MKITAICFNTFREAVRDKVLYSLIFFAFVMISMGTVLDRITIGQTDKLIKDFGLGCITIFGVLIAIFMGINLVFKELEKRTIYTILTKPIYRYEFLLGKYLGLLLTLFIEVCIMTAGLYLFLMLFGEGKVEFSLLKAVLLIYLQLSVLTAVALFFSAFSTPFLSGMFSLGIYIIGNLTDDLLVFSQKMEKSMQLFAKFVYYIFPNFSILNINGQVVHQQVIETKDLLSAAAYGVLYSGFIMIAAVLIFQRREFK